MLAVNDVSRRFGDKVALDSVSFTTAPGQMMGFVGPNGAGKTTTMRIILGLLEPDSGDVRWREQPLDADLRRRIGYMPEERGLYPKMRSTDQLAYVARLHGAGADEARASADAWLDRLGLAERAGDPLEKLSLGNQQRVQLGAALVHEPDVLVLDEPFSGLDPVGVDVMAETLVEECKRGAAVLFSSHQLELVERLCEEVTIIKEGRVVTSGAVEELRRKHARRLVRVAVEDARPGWEQAVDGTQVVARENGTVTLELAEGVDDQRLLFEAQTAGRLRGFGPVEPTLAELFREVVE